MNGWITFWKIVCIIGLGSFYLSVLVIIPLGARDITALLKQLGSKRDRDDKQ